MVEKLDILDLDQPHKDAWLAMQAEVLDTLKLYKRWVNESFIIRLYLIFADQYFLKKWFEQTNAFVHEYKILYQDLLSLYNFWYTKKEEKKIQRLVLKFVESYWKDIKNNDYFHLLFSYLEKELELFSSMSENEVDWKEKLERHFELEWFKPNFLWRTIVKDLMNRYCKNSDFSLEKLHSDYWSKSNFDIKDDKLNDQSSVALAHVTVMCKSLLEWLEIELNSTNKNWILNLVNRIFERLDFSGVDEYWFARICVACEKWYNRFLKMDFIKEKYAKIWGRKNFMKEILGVDVKDNEDWKIVFEEGQIVVKIKDLNLFSDIRMWYKDTSDIKDTVWWFKMWWDLPLIVLNESEELKRNYREFWVNDNIYAHESQHIDYATFAFSAIIDDIFDWSQSDSIDEILATNVWGWEYTQTVKRLKDNYNFLKNRNMVWTFGTIKRSWRWTHWAQLKERLDENKEFFIDLCFEYRLWLDYLNDGEDPVLRFKEVLSQRHSSTRSDFIKDEIKDYFWLKYRDFINCKNFDDDISFLGVGILVTKYPDLYKKIISNEIKNTKEVFEQIEDYELEKYRSFKN